jgi:hypothetical protein
MQWAFYTVAVQISFGKQREIVRTNVVRRIDRSFNTIKSDAEFVDLDAQNSSVLKVA